MSPKWCGSIFAAAAIHTAGGMAYVIPDDVYEAVRRGVPAYALYPDNRKELISSVEEADHLNMNGTLFGIRPHDKKLLNYLVERPSMKGELFSEKELLLLDSILLHTGKMNALNERGRESLDRMIQKLDLVVSPTGNEENEANGLWIKKCSRMNWNGEVIADAPR